MIHKRECKNMEAEYQKYEQTWANPTFCIAICVSQSYQRTDSHTENMMFI